MANYPQLEEEAALIVNIKSASRGYNQKDCSLLVLERLKERGLVEVIGGRVALTDEGEDIAEGIYGALLDKYQELIQ